MVDKKKDYGKEGNEYFKEAKQKLEFFGLSNLNLTRGDAAQEYVNAGEFYANAGLNRKSKNAYGKAAEIYVNIAEDVSKKNTSVGHDEIRMNLESALDCYEKGKFNDKSKHMREDLINLELSEGKGRSNRYK